MEGSPLKSTGSSLSFLALSCCSHSARGNPHPEGHVHPDTGPRACVPRTRVSPFPFPLLTSNVTVVGSQTVRQFSVTRPAARLMSHLGSRGGSRKQSVQALQLISRIQRDLGGLCLGWGSQVYKKSWARASYVQAAGQK